MTIQEQTNLKLTIKFLLSLLFIAMSLRSPGIYAQSQWLDYGTGNSVSLEIYKPVIPIKVLDPNFDILTPGLTAGSMSFFLTGRYNISKQYTLVADIPFVNGKYDDTIEVENEGGFEFGNPYIGAEYNVPESPIKLELGFRIPVVGDDKVQASITGTRSDIDRSEAFVKEIFPVYAAVNYQTVTDTRILVKARFGTDIWFNSKKLGGDIQPALFALYTLQTGYLNKYVHIIMGLSGRYDVNSGPNYPQKLNYIQYGLLIALPFKDFRPGFSIKFPGGKANDILNYVLGINCTYGFD